jgi:hypothetical protein
MTDRDTHGNSGQSGTFSRPSARWWWAFWLILAVVLWAPAFLAMDLIGGYRSSAHVFTALATLAIACALAGLQGLLRLPVFWFVLALVISSLIFLRLLYFGIAHFSGAGFTDEFFLHLEWQSVVVAWKEYPALVLGGLLGIAVLAVAVLLTGRRLAMPSVPVSMAVLMVSLVLTSVGREHLPEWQLIDGWRNWHQDHIVELDDETRERLEATGLIDLDIPSKNRVRARLPEQPRNLLLVYLESIGTNLTEQADWPGLMPGLERLLAEHSFIDTFWTSSYITIEGLTNSQCGTLFPFARGSESMAGGSGLAEHLPCLGDVLGAAGYHQVYLGGAGMSFAGKGDFLAAHGYDELKGMEHWREAGLEQRPGKWGLSDTELFEQSIAEIERLRANDRPFNLTMLTIGAHVPGYVYRECDGYDDDAPRFINAIACTDQLLTEWLAQLTERDLLRDTVLVITADHHVFPSPDMRELFGDSVHDRRLPFIVIGEDLPDPKVNEGALYDLAPTVLDLLGIEHDAAFALGRSLVRELSRPDYFIKRYADIYQGQRHEINPRDCDEAEPSRNFGLPLDPCTRGELLGSLSTLARSLSEPPDRMACREGQERLVAGKEVMDGFELVIGGVDQSRRFVYQGRPIEPNRPGLYLLSLDVAGVVIQRRYYPEDLLDEPDLIVDALETDDTAFKILIWRPSSTTTADAHLDPLGISFLPDDGLLIAIDRSGEALIRERLSELTDPLSDDAIWSSLCQAIDDA